MTGSKMRRLVCATVLTATALFGGAGAASAASPQVTEIDLPAGLGCSFPLHIVSVGGQEFREIRISTARHDCSKPAKVRR